MRSQTYAKATLDLYASFGINNHQTADASWIHRASLPFDTSSLPDNVAFDLNASGFSWIDPTGMTFLGLRGGYDVDDVMIPGEESILIVSFRNEASPSTGPKLTVRYVPVPEPGATTGLLAGAALLAGLRLRSGRTRRA